MTSPRPLGEYKPEQQAQLSLGGVGVSLSDVTRGCEDSQIVNPHVYCTVSQDSGPHEHFLAEHSIQQAKLECEPGSQSRMSITLGAQHSALFTESRMP